MRLKYGVLFALVNLATLIFAPRSLSTEPQSIRSRSGQFIVRGLPLAAPPSANASSPVSFIRLDPSVLAVSCEQVKQALLQELGLADEWRGTIHISLHPVKEDHESIRVISVHYTDGWGYRVEIPEQIDRGRLFRALVEVLLREIANRRAGPRQPELPVWLIEGFVAHLQALHPGSLPLSSDTRMVNSGRRPDPLEPVRALLRTNQPLTLNQLSWPTAEQLSRTDASTYRACSQLLLSELLRLKNGRKCLVDLLLFLPDYFNWQSAFLRAYRDYFPTLTTFDKWWALVVVNFSGREQMFLWGGAATLQQLHDILAVPVQVRLSREELPLLTDVKLQSVIAEWDYAAQSQLLLQKANHLQALRWRSPAEYIVLIDGYREAMISYVERRGKANGSRPGNSPPSSAARGVIAEAVRKLDRLDAERLALAEAQNPPTSAPRMAGAR